MSGFGAHHGDSAGLPRWRALSGDAQPAAAPMPAPMPAPAPAPAPAGQQPIHGGWQQAWQDEQGQWHYPYAAAQPQPQGLPLPMPMPEAAPAPAPAVPASAAPAAPLPTAPPSSIVPLEQLAPVGPPRYAAPARAAQDPSRRTLAAVITFVSLLVGLWAILGFTDSLARTMSSIASGNEKLKLQLADANGGLAKLDAKTGSLEAMSADSGRLKDLLGTIDTDMGGMLTGVDTIATSMKSMEASLGTLDEDLTAVDELNSGMAGTLGTIDTGLASQVRSVRTMRRDVEATGTVVGSLPGRLGATNDRLGYIVGAINTMGCRGVTNNLKVNIFLGPLRNGSATVYATVVPPGAWGTKADGVTPC